MKYQIKFKKTKMWAKQFWQIIECEGASINKFQNSTKTVRIVIGKYSKYSFEMHTKIYLKSVS